MDALVVKNVVGQVYNFVSKRFVYHSLFWLAFFFMFTILHMTETNHSLGFTVLIASITIVFYSSIVYFNTLYLIPNFLTQKKFARYCLLLLLAVFIVTSIKVFVLYFVYHGDTIFRERLVTDQGYFYLLTFMFAGSSTIFKIITDWVRHQRERQILETQTMQSELKFLRSQINPHFLFNTLNNLYALTLKKSDKAPEIVIKLSEMMRYMLYECNEKRVDLSKEVNYLKNYLDLERLRQGKNVEINFEVKGSVSDQRIAPLMFIPFIENSFKHGLNNHITKGFVNIKLDIEDNCVYMNIENSKPEKLPMKEHAFSGGIGLVNVRRRLNILYPDHYTLNIKDNPKTYVVNLKIELV